MSLDPIMTELFLQAGILIVLIVVTIVGVWKLVSNILKTPD